MQDWSAFALAALAVLFAPGPTNTLLAMSGAAAGFGKSAKLVLAAMLGYIASTIALSLLVGPVVQTSPVLGVALRLACAAYLVYTAWKLWREGAEPIASARPVPFRDILMATLLNPKSVLLAFVIVPFLAQGRVVEATPYLSALLVMIGLAGASWVAIGAAIRSGASRFLTGAIVRRAGAVVLFVFAAILSASVLTPPDPAQAIPSIERPADKAG
jgi:threonine/homoserine/homoserine lactone efflux protein